MKHLLGGLCIFTCLFFPTLTFGQSLSATDILKRSDNMMRGNTSFMRLEMRITTPKWTRTVRLDSWSKGSDYSFIHILYPPRDKGVTFLKRKTDMWQYIPKVERIIKLPPSMMMQSWMGSDFTNDDLVRESSLEEDYSSKRLPSKKTRYVIELIPHEHAPVTWGKVIMEIHKTTFIPLYQEFYDELGELVRTITLDTIQKRSGRWIPMHWTITPKDPQKKGQFTELFVKKATFNQPIPDTLFSLRSLKRKSR